MKINQFTSINPKVNTTNNPAFSGKVITKGPWTDKLKDAFLNSKGINELASGDKDVIGRLICKAASKDDYNHMWGEPVFKLSIEMQNSKPSLTERIKSMLRISRQTVNKYYHKESSLAEKISSMSKEFLESCMNKG